MDKDAMIKVINSQLAESTDMEFLITLYLLIQKHNEGCQKAS